MFEYTEKGEICLVTRSLFIYWMQYGRTIKPNKLQSRKFFIVIIVAISVRAGARGSEASIADGGLVNQFHLFIR